MMKKFNVILAAACSMMTFTGCVKEVTNLSDQDALPTSQLRITTRADGSGSGSDGSGESSQVTQGRLYLFGASGCIDVLSTDEDTQTAVAEVAAGTIGVYAVGGSDLSRFSLPAKQDATTTTEIGLNEGMVMDDLLMTHAEVTMTDGETRQLNLNLERKVIGITSITIKQVPTDVTKVEVSLEPLYSAVLLDGTYADRTASYKQTLTKQTGGTGQTGNTWQSTAESMQFPSKGNPTITVYFTRSSGVTSYSYTASAPIPANHHVTIEGTYVEPIGITLKGIISGSQWEEDVNISFNFDESNSSGSGGDDSGNGGGDDSGSGNSGGDDSGNGNSGGDDSGNSGSTTVEKPVAGQYFKGCYVVSVTGNTALLLSADEVVGFDTDDTKQAASIKMLNDALADWPTPEDISGTWRIPTDQEAESFIIPNVAMFSSPSNYTDYYCLENNVLKAFRYKTSGNENKKFGVIVLLGDKVILRPVLDYTIPAD